MPTSHEAPPQWRKVFDPEIGPWLADHRNCAAFDGGTTPQACGAKWWLLQQREARGLTFPIPQTDNGPPRATLIPPEECPPCRRNGLPAAMRMNGE